MWRPAGPGSTAGRVRRPMGAELYLVVVAVGDGVGGDSRLLHLQKNPDGEDRLAVLTTQLHQDPVTHLQHTHLSLKFSSNRTPTTFQIKSLPPADLFKHFCRDPGFTGPNPDSEAFMGAEHLHLFKQLKTSNRIAFWEAPGVCWFYLAPKLVLLR